jgi:flagellar hook-associated protein 2
MSVNTSIIVSSLGAGSGIDIKNLAQSLVEAERKPLKDRIDAKITKSEAKISGYGAVRAYLEPLKASLEKLKSASNFGTLSLSNSQPAAFSASMGATATTGSHEITVAQLASAQRTRSAGFASATDSINGADPLSLTLTMGGNARTVSVAAPASPQAMADAINLDATTNNTGLTAELVPYSSGGSTFYALEVQGKSGVANGYALSIDPASFAGGTPPALQNTMLQEAGDARLRVNGLSISSASNTITDAITGVTLDLTAVSTSIARVVVTRDLKGAKDNINGLIDNYNNFQEAMKELGDSGSKVETLGGSLAGDRLLKNVRTQVRNMFRGFEGDTSSVRALTDLGIAIESDGRMKLRSEAKLDMALKFSFDATVSLFASNPKSTTGGGMAGDAIASIDALISNKAFSKGLLEQQIQSTTKDVNKYKAELTKLEERLKKTLNRYMSQFSVMESIVGNSNGVRSGLKNTFESMSSSYR